MRHRLVHHKACQVLAISFREPVSRDRRKNRFGHQACSQDGELSEKRNGGILITGQMFSSPEAYPGHQSKGKDRMTQALLEERTSAESSPSQVLTSAKSCSMGQRQEKR